MGEKEGLRDGETGRGREGEVLKVELGMRPPARRGHRAYAPEGMRERRKLGRWEDEKVGEKAGLRDEEVWKDLKR